MESLEARAVTLYVVRISEHTRITHVQFVDMRGFLSATVEQGGGLAYLGVKKHGWAGAPPLSMRDYPCPGPLLLWSARIAEPRATTKRVLPDRRSSKSARLWY
jgi:hypothetical protein